jgi:hypothetical protein
MKEFFEENKGQFQLYARANGSLKAQKILKVLGKTESFARAFSSQVGQEILMDAIQESEVLLDKIVKEEASEGDRAEFRAFKKIITRWEQIWNSHNAALEELKNAK